MRAQAWLTDGICKHDTQQKFELSQVDVLQVCAKSVLLPNTSIFKKQTQSCYYRWQFRASPNSFSVPDVEPKSRWARIRVYIPAVCLRNAHVCVHSAVSLALTAALQQALNLAIIHLQNHISVCGGLRDKQAMLGSPVLARMLPIDRVEGGDA